MDFYAYLNAKGDTFNLDYIRTECKKHRREVKAGEKVVEKKNKAELEGKNRIEKFYGRKGGIKER